MSDLVVFIPQHKLDCQKNYDEFVSLAKNKLTLFNDFEDDNKKGWDCEKWSWHAENGRKLTIVFGNSSSAYQHEPFKAPFADFAKAYVRYELSINAKLSTVFFSSLVWVYRALEEKALENSLVDIMNINNDVINTIAKQIEDSELEDSTKRNLNISLQHILAFIRESKFKFDLQGWTNPSKRSTDTSIQLDKESQSEEKDKCPSDYQMLQVADAYHKAKTLKQKFVTSLCVIMMCQPSRVVELKGLTVNSLQRSDKGRLFLMWNPAKGGDPVKKWVPVLLESVVEAAFKRLVEISSPARKAAKYAYENSDAFMIHEECITSENHNQDTPLRYNQFAKAMGLVTGEDSKGGVIVWSHMTTKWVNSIINDLNNVTDWKKDILRGESVLEDNRIVTKSPIINGKVELLDRTIIFPSYKNARTYVDKTYKKTHFPNYGAVKIWDCITLVRENEFHADFAVKPFSWTFYGQGSLSDAIGSNRIKNAKSIFDEHKITDEDGSPISLTTHQFRHWLNTKLMLGGVEDWLIAKWSGRANINQNKDYDGRTTAQKSRLIKLIGRTKSSKSLTVGDVNTALSKHSAHNPPSAFVLHELSLPISLKALGVPRTGVAQFTGLGYCVHNYAESPCGRNGDCATCTDHVCIKGIANTLDELKRLEALHSEQLEHAEASSLDDIYGADQWVIFTSIRLAKVKTIISILEDERNPNGIVVRIPNELNDSPVKRSLMNNAETKDMVQPIDLMALTQRNLGLN
jgi:hypothetical protein